MSSLDYIRALFAITNRRSFEAIIGIFGISCFVNGDRQFLRIKDYIYLFFRTFVNVSTDGQKQAFRTRHSLQFYR